MADASELNPKEFSLSPAYPNPFNPLTHLDLKIPTTESVKISIVDILGREIAKLHSGVLVQGNYKFSWNGTNHLGLSVASGTYFAVAGFEKNTQIQKLLLLK